MLKSWKKLKIKKHQSKSLTMETLNKKKKKRTKFKMKLMISWKKISKRDRKREIDAEDTSSSYSL